MAIKNQIIKHHIFLATSLILTQKEDLNILVVYEEFCSVFQLQWSALYSSLELIFSFLLFAESMVPLLVSVGKLLQPASY